MDGDVKTILNQPPSLTAMRTPSRSRASRLRTAISASTLRMSTSAQRPPPPKSTSQGVMRRRPARRDVLVRPWTLRHRPVGVEACPALLAVELAGRVFRMRDGVAVGGRRWRAWTRAPDQAVEPNILKLNIKHPRAPVSVRTPGAVAPWERRSLRPLAAS